MHAAVKLSHTVWTDFFHVDVQGLTQAPVDRSCARTCQMIEAQCVALQSPKLLYAPGPCSTIRVVYQESTLNVHRRRRYYGIFPAGMHAPLVPTSPGFCFRSEPLKLLLPGCARRGMDDNLLGRQPSRSCFQQQHAPLRAVPSKDCGV